MSRVASPVTPAAVDKGRGAERAAAVVGAAVFVVGLVLLPAAAASCWPASERMVELVLPKLLSLAGGLVLLLVDLAIPSCCSLY